MNYWRMTDDELGKAIRQMEHILEIRGHEDIKKAENEMKELIARYKNQGLSFYLADGYGNNKPVNIRDIFCDEYHS